MFYTTYPSPVGKLYLAAEEEKLIGLWLEGQKYFPKDLGEQKEDALPFPETKRWLDRYFNGERPSPEELLLAPKGSDFRQAVWEELLNIPYGELVTYGAIAGNVAEKLGLPSMSAQAVGGAVGHNPISIIIPCHRVVGSDGSLTGYAGGVEKKKTLLSLEGALYRAPLKMI